MRLNRLQQHLLKLGLPPQFVKKTHIPNGTKVHFRLWQEKKKIFGYRIWSGDLTVNGESSTSQYYGIHPFRGCYDRDIGYICTECGYTSDFENTETKFRVKHGTIGFIGDNVYCKKCKRRNTIASIMISNVTKIISLTAIA